MKLPEFNALVMHCLPNIFQSSKKFHDGNPGILTKFSMVIDYLNP